MTRDERIQAGMIPVCEACKEYEETACIRDWCKSPICDKCDSNGKHEEYHETLWPDEQFECSESIST